MKHIENPLFSEFRTKYQLFIIRDGGTWNSSVLSYTYISIKYDPSNSYYWLEHYNINHLYLLGNNTSITHKELIELSTSIANINSLSGAIFWTIIIRIWRILLDPYPSRQQMLNLHQNDVKSWRQLTINHRTKLEIFCDVTCWHQIGVKCWHQIDVAHWHLFVYTAWC